MPRLIFHHHLLCTALIYGTFLLSFAACSGNPATTSQATPTAIPLPVMAEKPTYQVQRGEIKNELQFSGRIAPAVKQELGFASDGRVAKVHVRRGDAVTKDQLLAELESGQNEYDLRRAQANLKIAQLRLELARLQSPQNSEINRLNVAIQEQEVELAQIALDELDSIHSNVRITAPFDGTVFSVLIIDGSTVEANQAVIVVANMDDLIVSATLGPDEMSVLTAGMKVNVSPVGRNTQTAQGTIRSLPYPYGSADTEAPDGSVHVALDQSPLQLGYNVGDMVSMSIVLEKKTDALWLPSQAVREFEGRYFVIMQDGEAQRRVDVKVGIIEKDRIEITDGLAEGQVVVVP
ncbi:MAG TPA: efflux RND transporter periplasmic adaptor subunit [Anaerolineales bacterium]|nr:efflux RND transporter periplasmic adaptor subunit [Anaerolineales bacterium]